MRVSRKFLIAAVSIALVGVLAVLVVPAFIRARNTPSQASCVLYLLEIDGAKNQWSLVNRKGTNEVPTWDDLCPYVRWASGGPLKCPQGGTYRLGRVGETPTCSIGGPEHTLPVVPPPRITAAQAETIAADWLRQKKMKPASYGKPQIEFDPASRQWKLFYTRGLFAAPGEHFTINVDENGGARFVGGL